MYQPRNSDFFQNLYGSTATGRTHVRFIASRYLLFFSQRNMERKIDARKGAWEGEEKGGKASCFSSFLPLMSCELTWQILLINHRANTDKRLGTSLNPRYPAL